MKNKRVRVIVLCVLILVAVVLVLTAQYAVTKNHNNMTDDGSDLYLTVRGQYQDEMYVFDDVLETIVENDISDGNIDFLRGQLSLITETELNFKNTYEVGADKKIREDMFNQETFYQTVDAVKSLKTYLINLGDAVSHQYSKGVHINDFLSNSEFLELNAVLKEEVGIVRGDFFGDETEEKQDEWLTHMEKINDISLKLTEMCQNYLSYGVQQ